MKPNDLMNDVDSQAPATDVFNGLSRKELLAVLGAMHRILGAEKKCDLDHLATELPTLFADRIRRWEPPADNPRRERLLESARAKREHAYQALNYVFSCLSKAQAKMEPIRRAQLLGDKHACQLSPRELTVLLWMKEGKTNWEIARILGVSERTVRFHAGSIFEKLDVTSRTQAVARALEAGLIAS
jgi:DNA-binding CsgD family transcriptional regulator